MNNDAVGVGYCMFVARLFYRLRNGVKKDSWKSLATPPTHEQVCQ